MKYALLTLALSLAVCSCLAPQKEQLETYLNKEYPASGFKVISVSKPAMYYTPFDALLSLGVTLLEAGDINALDDGFYESYNRSLVATDNLVGFSQAHPELCNRKGFEASVESREVEADILVLFEKDGKTIGHTSIYLSKKMSEINDQLDRLSYGY